MKATSPKVIMQIMQRHAMAGAGESCGEQEVNQEVALGKLNTEHIKSHLQKFRQYSEVRRERASGGRRGGGVARGAAGMVLSLSLSLSLSLYLSLSLARARGWTD